MKLQELNNEKIEGVEIVFIYEYIKEDTFAPSCIVFYTKNEILNQISFEMSINDLKDNGHNSISSYLFTELNIFEEHLLKDGTPATSYDLSLINESSEDITREKRKLNNILRKQKIEKILK